MKTLTLIQDELDVIRDYVECAYLACGQLEKEVGSPLRTVLSEASDKLKAVDRAIEFLKTDVPRKA